MQQEGATLVSSDDLTLDGVDAIQQVYHVDELDRIYIFAKQDQILVRLIIMGEPDTLEDHRAEIDDFIAHVRFRPVPADGDS
jgi:hypothetical protein